MSAAILIRPWQATDSIDELTDLLHRSYASLAAMGLRYWATHQSADVTRKRIEQGTCLLAVVDGVMQGTVVFRDAAGTSGCPWYGRADVASFAQFAVSPQLQKNGLGLQLLRGVEALAASSGAAELALDTAEPATHLVDWYTRLGYRFVEHTQWAHTNYRSVVLSKSLSGDLSLAGSAD
jgi:GNAT superfamily N-acetyltransferase